MSPVVIATEYRQRLNAFRSALRLTIPVRAAILRGMTASVVLATTAAPVAAQDLPIGWGLSYLSGSGAKADPVVTLLYGVIAISLFVVLVVSALVLYGVFTRRARPEDGRVASVPIERSGQGLLLIYVGSGLAFLALFGTALWGYVVLADIAGPKGATPVTIRVTGHQWWWEVEYLSPEPDRNFRTANGIHIPVGLPVRVELRSDDVIHSFWVPKLSGKMDTIPTQHNETWIEADVPGVYRGQCTEYCGRQHAHMAFEVTAEPPAAFDAWWQDQLEGAPMPPPAFMKNCAVCHTVRGTPAQGRVGPDLSHLAERLTIAAGTLPNTIGNLSGWIANPQRIKPGNHMPTLTLSAAELKSVRDYLVSLR